MDVTWQVTSIPFMCRTAIDGIPCNGLSQRCFRLSFGAAAGTERMACFLKTDYEEQLIISYKAGVADCTILGNNEVAFSVGVASSHDLRGKMPLPQKSAPFPIIN